MKTTIQRANIVRSAWPVEPDKTLALYQGSGRFGGCFHFDGLMESKAAHGFRRTGQTMLFHADHWHHGKYGIDHHVPLGRLHWGHAPGEPKAYRQELDLFSGVLTTEWFHGPTAYTLRTSFSPDHRDWLLVEFEFRGDVPEIVFTPEARHLTNYEDNVRLAPGTRFARTPEGLWSARIRQGTADSEFVCRVLHGENESVVVQGGARLRLRPIGKSGRIVFLLATSAWTRAPGLLRDLKEASSPELGADFASAWEKRWGTTTLDIAEPSVHALWTRSVYHILCSYAPDVRCPASPMGWTGNAWGYHFPQDLSYIHPALLRLGHHDIARAIVEFYHGRIPQMREMTRRIYRSAGVLWAWEFPIGPDSRQLEDGAPNAFQFETHNAAYPARMAAETADALGDTAWARDVAWPILLESADFYAANLRRKGGTWSLHVNPSMGQDEFGGENARNYLCALFAAEYTLSTALAFARRWRIPIAERATWAGILRDGLAYERIYRPKLGVYATSEKPGYRLGRQKHPAQINPLWILPMGRVDEPTRRAYSLRHRLCENRRDGFHHAGVAGSYYNGWTLAAYWLAAANCGDATGLEHDWRQILVSQYADSDFIQIYESSGFWCPYYTTSMGLFLQAVLAAASNSAWPPTWGPRPKS
ncbi:MAG: hypothetical protein WCS65_08860 [Verrucomicrobiae bacterium]